MMKNTLRNVIECCNNTRGATYRQTNATYTRTWNCSVDHYSAILYTQNMHVEWKTVTGNPQVTRKVKEFAKNVLRMQHQPEACASDLGDGSHVICW